MLLPSSGQRPQLENFPSGGVQHRFIALCLASLTMLVGLCGCQSFPRMKSSNRDAPVLTNNPHDVQVVLSKMNEQAARVEFLKTDARIAIDGMPGLRGDLVVQRPDNLRLKAGLMGMSEMGFDLGYNRELFWIWKKVSAPGDPPALYYAYHDEFQQSAIHDQIPLQPKWLMDGLGLPNFRDPNPEYRQRPDGHIDVVAHEHESRRNMIRVITVDPRKGLVLQQAFYNQQGQRIAYIDSQSYRYYPETKVSLPQRVKIHVFDAKGQESKIVVDFGEFSINSFYGNQENLWVMPNPGDVPLIDLSAPADRPLQMDTAEKVSRNWDPNSIQR